jgi:electron transfer flavoprotein alpha/beta subunit
VSLLNLPRGSVPAVFAQIGVVIATVLTYPLVYVVEHIVTKGQLLNSR